MPSALFTVNGSSAQQAHVVTFGSTISYALVNTAGCYSAEYSIVGLSHAGLTIPVVSMSATVGTGSHAMPSDPGADRAFLIECVVNGGKDASGRPDPNLRCSRVIGTTSYQSTVPLVLGETLERDATVGWVLPFNSVFAGRYRLVSMRVVTSGTTSFTPTSGARALLVECVGGGGAGGGCATGTGSAAASGGAGGAYAASWLVGAAVKTIFTVAVGAGGTPGSAGAVAGGNGGETTFDSPSVCTARGGYGGRSDTCSATAHLVAGQESMSGNVGNLHVASGMPSGNGISLAAASALSGAGGSSVFGGGALSRLSQGNGNAADGFSNHGGGGSGGLILSGGADVAGGAGASGLIRVWEFA